MGKIEVAKWYGKMLARFTFMGFMIAFYSAEVLNSIV